MRGGKKENKNNNNNKDSTRRHYSCVRVSGPKSGLYR